MLRIAATPHFLELRGAQRLKVQDHGRRVFGEMDNDSALAGLYNRTEHMRPCDPLAQTPRAHVNEHPVVGEERKQARYVETIGGRRKGDD